MQKKSLLTVLAGHEFLKEFHNGHLELLTGCAANVRFDADKMLFEAGGGADRFYLIRKGRVAIELPVCKRKIMTIQTVGAGELLGWSWLIPPYRWHLSARALEPVLALSFDGKCIRGKFDRDPALGYEFHRRFSRVIAARMENTFLQMVGLSD
ncbi:MAG: cyclic nucleotide-binding domain-containing protein [Elusimicrobia bacterium]|nr:cyclic nucleotide-binding domain-containing protein [Elusimicrobiota bacterium]